MNNNPWIENTGTVPDGVGPDTSIEVEYGCGETAIWDQYSSVDNNNPKLWSFDEDGETDLDVIRWRFV